MAIAALALLASTLPALAAELPAGDAVQPAKLFEVDNYCEGVVFDDDGRGYISHGKVIVKFKLDGKHKVWAETGSPNGHKILADGTHLVCDASQHAMLHLRPTASCWPTPRTVATASRCAGQTT